MIKLSFEFLSLILFPGNLGVHVPRTCELLRDCNFIFCGLFTHLTASPNPRSSFRVLLDRKCTLPCLHWYWPPRGFDSPTCLGFNFIVPEPARATSFVHQCPWGWRQIRQLLGFDTAREPKTESCQNLWTR